jgi:hypothetical protein
MFSNFSFPLLQNWKEMFRKYEILSSEYKGKNSEVMGKLSEMTGIGGFHCILCFLPSFIFFFFLRNDQAIHGHILPEDGGAPWNAEDDGTDTV